MLYPLSYEGGPAKASGDSCGDAPQWGAVTDPLATVASRLAPLFADLAEGVDAEVRAAVADPVVRPSNRADAQVNGALPLAKALGANPRDIAQRVLDKRPLAGIAGAEIAGPGFINITFDDDFIAAELSAVVDDDRLGVHRAERPEIVVIDYSAPNVAKEMHVGHLPSTVIGDSLVRIHTFVGHKVIRENHIGDWGRQYGMLIEHLVDLGAEPGTHLSVGDLDAFYKEANVKLEQDPEFLERSRRRVVLLQSGDPETTALWTSHVEVSTEYFNRVYDFLGVLLTDDDLAGESRYQPMVPDVLARLEAAGLLTESDGALVVFAPGFTNREGEPLPLIIKSRSGGFNYATSDLACVIDRVERVGANRMLYVVAAQQAQHFQMVFAVARMAGWLPAERDAGHDPAVHVAFGNVLGADRKMFRSRSGESVKFIDLLDEAVERARAAVGEKHADLPDDVKGHVARAIGIGAVKYAQLSTDRMRDSVFDWDRMLSFDGNTAPYLQYAHARICSIFRRAEVERASVRGSATALASEHERALALAILGYDAAVWDTLDTLSPHKLCTYLYDLASQFTTFYEHCPVLRADDDATRQSRLVLCDATASVLGHGLGLLGIDAPEQI